MPGRSVVAEKAHRVIDHLDIFSGVMTEEQLDAYGSAFDAARPRANQNLLGQVVTVCLSPVICAAGAASLAYLRVSDMIEDKKSIGRG
jgi:hypothetical protein